MINFGVFFQMLMSSKDLQNVMGLILAFGNYMNGGELHEIIVIIGKFALKF